MNKIFAIAGLAIRTAVRSRVFIWLMILLVSAIIVLPLILKGDGSAAGRAQVLIHYNLRIIAIILTLATVWVACGSVSTEIRDRHIHLLVTKPVSRLQLWLGKWFGILCINAALLSIGGGLTYGLLLWETREGVLTEEDRATLAEEVFVARRPFYAETKSHDSIATETLEALMVRGDIPENMPAQRAYKTIKRFYQLRENSVLPGTVKEWRFELPMNMGPDEDVILRYRFSSSRQAQRRSTAGMWTAGRKNDLAPFRHRHASYPGGAHQFTVPRAAIPDDGVLYVKYMNAETKYPATVVFDGNSAVTILANSGSFSMNFLRAMLVLFIRLAFFASLGVTAGSLLSMPVAVFLSFFVLSLSSFGDYIASVASTGLFYIPHHPEHVEPTTFLNTIAQSFFKCMNVVSSPLARLDPLESLPSGLLISWAFIAESILFLLIIYAGLSAVLGVGCFNRREVAL